eukprot:COSAG05_NODE_11925_length_490_cov_0.936061_2_plen_81_part_00
MQRVAYLGGQRAGFGCLGALALRVRFGFPRLRFLSLFVGDRLACLRSLTLGCGLCLLRLCRFLRTKNKEHADPSQISGRC